MFVCVSTLHCAISLQECVVIRFCLTILSANVTFISVLFALNINLTCTCVRRAQIFSPLMMKTCCDDLLHNSKRFVQLDVNRIGKL